MRALAAVALCVLIAGCAPQIAPPGTRLSTPSLSEDMFITADGLQLPVRRWLPAQPPRGVVLAVHGFNDYSKSFDKVPDAPGVGPTLADKGYAVFAYDQRSFGRSLNAGYWPGGDQLANDFKDFVGVLSQTYPEVPVYAIGVSMGGAVLISALASDTPPPVRAVVLVAPAVWGREAMPLLYTATLWLGAHTMPWAKPSGQSLGRLASDNIEMLRDASRDPLFIKDTRIDSIYGLTNLMDQALANIGAVTVPTLYIYGANDEIIPKNATEKALARFLNAQPERRFGFYENGWHMMLRDLQAETVLSDVASFFADPAQPLPSGADLEPLSRFNAAQ
ncbi:MAG: alpha/beta hydrolase [Rhodospirillaceae bacterium]